MTKLRGVIALFAAAVLVATAGVPAGAARMVTIRGGGWGHGIGMSQYGAYGRAGRGASASAILEHYYSGTRVGTADMPRRVRVGLLQGRSAVTFTSKPGPGGGGGLVLKEAGVKDELASEDAGTPWRVEPATTGGMRVFVDGNRIRRNGRGAFGGPNRPLTLVYEKQGSLVDVGDKAYDYAYGRLKIESYPTDSCAPGYCLRLVLVVTMQKYLYGLGEVPASWPKAALEAQAIAGRTYAFEKVRRLGQQRYPCGCAVYDSTYDQAYIGDAKRSGSGSYWDDWKGAVDATIRRVVLHEGEPIQALYSSSSGGHTEHNENVWGGTPLPYLRGVGDAPDDVDANPNHTWEVQMTFAQFQQKLHAAYGIGDLEDFELVRPFGVSGRVTVVLPDSTGGARIKGTRKTVRVSGWSLRSALGLKDTLFRVDLSEVAADGTCCPSQLGVVPRLPNY